MHALFNALMNSTLHALKNSCVDTCFPDCVANKKYFYYDFLPLTLFRSLAKFRIWCISAAVRNRFKYRLKNIEIKRFKKIFEKKKNQSI